MWVRVHWLVLLNPAGWEVRRNTMKKMLHVITIFIGLLLLTACAANMESMGTSLLSSTGLVTDSQARSLFGAGKHLVKASQTLSDEEEHYLGRSVAAMILSKYRPYNRPALISYVNNVGNTVAAVSDKPETFTGYHFMVLDTDEVNAFATPGGFIFITKGLLRFAVDEDGLAAILAHEVAHVVKGHGVSAISKSNLTQALLIIGKEAAESQGNSTVQELTAAFGGSVKDVFNTLVENGYSRSQEYDADQYALILLARAGYDQSKFVTVLKNLESAAKEDSGGLFTTHPDPDDREDNIEDEIKAYAGSKEKELIRANRFKQATKGVG